jgi:PPP family 3-phenylpropionic acid transporter
MWSSATLLVVVLSVMFMPELKEPLHTSPQPPGEMGRMLKQPRVRWFFLGMFFHILSHIFLYIFFSLYLDSLGYSKTIIGMLWGFGVVVEVVWFFTQGRWLPLMPLTGWLMLASSLMAGRMLVTATLPHVLWLLFAVQALHAITFAAHHSVSIALLSDFFPARTRARGQALYSVVGYGLSGVVAGLLGGWASTTFGLQSVFWLSCGAALLAILAYQALQRNGITVDPKAHHNPGSGG